MSLKFYVAFLACASSFSQAVASDEDTVVITPLLTENHKVELSNGTFFVRQQWVQITSWPMVFEEAMAANVSFFPKRTAPACKNISFIQTAQVIDNHGVNYDWKLGEAPRNEVRSRGGFFVDHQAFSCEKGKPCSPFYRDYWPNSDEGSKDGSVSAAIGNPAILTDYPFGWSEISSIRLEACAVCRDTLFVYGCFQWGGHWGLTTDRAFHPVASSNEPSDEWREAVQKFYSYYSK